MQASWFVSDILYNQFQNYSACDREHRHIAPGDILYMSVVLLLRFPCGKVNIEQLICENLSVHNL
jgi:hypothetical protein